jgi:hypothetical protein
MSLRPNHKPDAKMTDPNVVKKKHAMTFLPKLSICSSNLEAHPPAKLLKKNNQNHDEVNDAAIGKCGLVPLQMRSKGRHDTKGHTKGEKDLRYGGTPSVGFLCHDRQVPDTHVSLHAIGCSGQRDSTSQEDKRQNYWKTQGKVGQTTSPLQSPEETEENNHPNKGKVSKVIPAHASEASGVGGVWHAHHVDKKISNRLGTRRRIPINLVTKGLEESIDDPFNKHGVVHTTMKRPLSTAERPTPRRRLWMLPNAPTWPI